MISGGAPPRHRYEWFDDLCGQVLAASPVPLDLMMTARPDDPGYMARLVNAGFDGFR